MSFSRLLACLLGFGIAFWKGRQGREWQVHGEYEAWSGSIMTELTAWLDGCMRTSVIDGFGTFGRWESRYRDRNLKIIHVVFAFRLWLINSYVLLLNVMSGVEVRVEEVLVIMVGVYVYAR